MMARPPKLPPEQQSVSIHFRMKPEQYDRTLKQASQARMTLADWLRHAVTKAMGPPDPKA